MGDKSELYITACYYYESKNVEIFIKLKISSCKDESQKWKLPNFILLGVAMQIQCNNHNQSNRDNSEFKYQTGNIIYIEISTMKQKLHRQNYSMLNHLDIRNASIVQSLQLETLNNV